MVGGLAAACALGGLGGVRSLRAASSWQSQPSPPAWHAVETANFRILNFGSQGVSRDIAQACEKIREQLAFMRSHGDLCARMGDEARRTVEKDFTWEATARKMISTYEKVIDSR